MAGASIFGDFNGDGRPDLLITSLDTDRGASLYVNGGDGKFTDASGPARLSDQVAAIRACAADFDHDGDLDVVLVRGAGEMPMPLSLLRNDGRLDLLVGDGDATIVDLVVHQMRVAPRRDCHPRLYRNVGATGFKDVSREVGLDWPIPSLSANFGDIDNDGFLDVYFGGGLTSEMAPAPNVLLRNKEGKRFEDVTETSGTRRLRTGHSVSFADWNGDGSLDLVVTSGGASPGSREDHLLFQNRGPARAAGWRSSWWARRATEGRSGRKSTSS